MIEINLLPGAKKTKKAKSAGPTINFAAIQAALAARAKDIWLIAAVVTGIVVLLSAGFMFLAQQRRESVLKEEETKAVADSTRYAVQLQERARAQARRDSALLQLSVIQAIDEERYIWPHFLDEVSRNLPPYTWLRSLTVIGTPQGLNPAAAIKPPPPPDPKKKNQKPFTPSIPKDSIRVRLIGRTVDLQAFTRFMRSLEDSPYIGSVQMQRSEPIIELGKDLTQFTIEMSYSRPDSLLVRRAPLTISSPR